MNIALVYRDAYRDALRDAADRLGVMASHEENEDASEALLRGAESLLHLIEVVTTSDEREPR